MKNPPTRSLANTNTRAHAHTYADTREYRVIGLPRNYTLLKDIVRLI